MPALVQASLMMAWHFWRGPLTEVWYTNFSLTLPLARMPSAPFFQPAASRIWLAFSGLYSNFVFLLTEARRVVEEVRRRDGAAAVDEPRRCPWVDEQVHRVAHRLVAEGRVLAFTLAFAVDLVPGSVGLSDHELDVAAGVEGHLCRAFQLLEDDVLDGQVPADVELAGLQHRARAPLVASPPPFSSMRVEEGLVRDVVVLLASPRSESPGLKSTSLYGPVPTGFRLAGVSRDLAPMKGSNTCLGRMGRRCPPGSRPRRASAC